MLIQKDTKRAVRTTLPSPSLRALLIQKDTKLAEHYSRVVDGFESFANSERYKTPVPGKTAPG